MSATKKSRARKTRANFSFLKAKLKPGTRLRSTFDPAVIAKVKDDKKVVFRGQEMSLSGAAKIVMKENGYKWPSIAGTHYWTHKDKKLYELVA